MAGEEGFEPPNARTKTWCLTTWPLPNARLILSVCSFLVYLCFTSISSQSIIYTNMPAQKRDMADHTLPLNINGLQGRMLRLPGSRRKKREFLFVYGHHTSLERVQGVAEFLNRYGPVTIPDLPGFGGMEPFYKIAQKPTLDTMADYLAAFIKLRYRNKRFTIVASSLGVAIVTRMLQKYPDIAKKIDAFASVAGFAHKDDFLFKKRNYWLMRRCASFFRHYLPAQFLHYIIFRKSIINFGYNFFEKIFIDKKSSKIQEVDAAERKKRIDFEVHLWQCNDVRTYMEMALAMLKLDLTHQHVDLDIYHVSIDDDRYFNNTQVEAHMRMIFRNFYLIPAKGVKHAPSVVATAKDAAPFVPMTLREVFKRKT
jgi:pimeloyl-ACP methyl ester carboxylesterase